MSDMVSRREVFSTTGGTPHVPYLEICQVNQTGPRSTTGLALTFSKNGPTPLISVEVNQGKYYHEAVHMTEDDLDQIIAWATEAKRLLRPVEVDWTVGDYREESA